MSKRKADEYNALEENHSPKKPPQPKKEEDRDTSIIPETPHSQLLFSTLPSQSEHPSPTLFSDRAEGWPQTTINPITESNTDEGTPLTPITPNQQAVANYTESEPPSPCLFEDKEENRETEISEEYSSADEETPLTPITPNQPAVANYTESEPPSQYLSGESNSSQSSVISCYAPYTQF